MYSPPCMTIPWLLGWIQNFHSWRLYLPNLSRIHHSMAPLEALWTLAEEYSLGIFLHWVALAFPRNRTLCNTVALCKHFRCVFHSQKSYTIWGTSRTISWQWCPDDQDLSLCCRAVYSLWALQSGKQLTWNLKLGPIEHQSYWQLHCIIYGRNGGGRFRKGNKKYCKVKRDGTEKIWEVHGGRRKYLLQKIWGCHGISNFFGAISLNLAIFFIPLSESPPPVPAIKNTM